MAQKPANLRKRRPWLTLTMILCTSVCLVRQQVAAHEFNVQGEHLTRQIANYELKFQNELENSTVMKHLKQQQVFKCQARLAPLSQQRVPAAINSRLSTTSTRVTSEEAREQQAQLLAGLHDDSLEKILQSSLSDDSAGRRHRQPLNVTHFSIDWLKDGQPIGLSLLGEQFAILNVTLKTQHTLDKTSKKYTRVEIKNTLNGQQMKLTSRLRIGNLERSDSAKYKCVARVAFFHRRPEKSEHQLASDDPELEFIEQSLESSETSLIVVEANTLNGETAPVPSNNFSSRPSNQKQQRMYNNNDQGLERSQLAPGNGHDNEVRQQKTVRLQLHSDDTQEEYESSSERASQVETDRSGQSARSNLNLLFEDDEDLFRLDSGEFISGKQPQFDSTNDEITPQNQQQLEGGNSNGADTMDGQANDLLAENERQRQHNAYFDWILDNGENRAQQMSSSGESLSLWGQQQQQQSADRFGDKKIDDHANSSTTLGDDHRSAQDRHRHQADHWNNQRLEHGQQQPPLDHGHQNPTLSMPPLLKSPSPPPFDPRRTKLGMLVHKIVPEPSCYTGRGEFYRGNASTSYDRRTCLNWLQVFAALESSDQQNHHHNQTSGTPLGRVKFFRRRQDYNHNHCRNPNSDPRGPWCFVVYSDELDGALVKQSHATSQSNQQRKLASIRQRQVVRINLTTGQVFVGVQCQLASCSEYLWLYVVAPPLGLLVLLICLITLTIRSIRKSHYNSIFTAAYQRHNSLDSSSSSSTSKSSNLLGKLLRSRKRLAIDKMGQTVSSVAAKRTETHSKLGTFKLSSPFSSSSATNNTKSKRKSSGHRGKYLDEDIFEVVDDIDWSDGQPTSTTSQSVSPSESFKMQSKADINEDQQYSNRSPANRQLNNWHQTRSTLAHSKSINPVYDGHRAGAPDLPSNRQFNRPTDSGNNTGNMTRMSKSKSQAGPMFATLRWHVRNVHQNQNQRRFLESNETGVRELGTQSAKKSSSFIENCANLGSSRLQDSSKEPETTCDRVASSSVTSNLSSLLTQGDPDNQIALTNAKTLKHDSNNSPNREFTLASELPKLDASSVTLAYDMQPIYEGKFSQVQMAYIKQRSDDLAQATGRIGAQVAVCSLKQQAALDESVFYATELRVRNLNHLNLVKLLGYVQLIDTNQLDRDNPDSGRNDASSLVRSHVKCSLVYDMAHVIDLSDWLKEQCKDAFDAQNDCDLGLRQNLTCLAKQIALAIDYLHDENILYKDLACRNCFLDVTRMLVKLASFNIEPEFDVQGGNCISDYYSTANGDEQISKKLSLKSMVRPKYLLDYYVIDSRPAECQLLPLSWLSLESILFNKFNKHTDIWSFGCLMYELFSLGEVAYFGYSSKQVIDSVRSNMMPPQPLLCPNGIYKLMCKCLSDIPTLRPNIKHVYEQLNLYSGQCSSFLNHHLCII